MSLNRSAKAIRGIAIFVLALALSASLTACGSDAPSASPNAERAASTSTPERAAATPDSTDTAAASTPETTPEIQGRGGVPQAADREALAAVYNATGGPDWKRSDNWLSDSPIGEWEGVDTDAQGRVVVLSLPANRLSGEIPPELGNLASLVRLNLQFNQLSGEIPPELGNLASLDSLNLRGNQLSGCVPAVWSHAYFGDLPTCE